MLRRLRSELFCPSTHTSKFITVDKCRDILRPEKLGENEALRPKTLKTNQLPRTIPDERLLNYIYARNT